MELRLKAVVDDLFTLGTCNTRCTGLALCEMKVQIAFKTLIERYFH